MLIYTPGKAEETTSHIVIKSITKQNKLTKINNQTGLHYPLQQKLPGTGHHLYHLPRSIEVCSNSTKRRKASPVNRSHPTLSSLQSGAFVTMITILALFEETETSTFTNKKNDAAGIDHSPQKPKGNRS